MKENQNSVLYDAEDFRRETNPFVMENEEIHQLKGSTTDTSPLAFERKAGDGRWNPFVDDFSMDIAKGNRLSHLKENTEEYPYSVNIEEDEDKLSSDSSIKEERQGHECSITAVEYRESRDSSLPSIAGPDLREPDTNMYTDKNVLECELPEFTVRYKEINYHIVKDICMDEGLPVVDTNSIGSYMHKEADHYIFQPRENKHCEDASMEFFISDELATSPFENKVSVNEDESGINEQRCRHLNALGKPKSPAESCLHEDTAKPADPENSEQQAGEANCSTTGYTATDAPKAESFIDKKLPIQEFGTRSFLRSFMSSLDFEEDRVDQLPDQITSGRAVSGSLVSPAEESKEDTNAATLLYNSEVGNGIITFNFNASSPVIAENSEDVIEQTAGSAPGMAEKTEDVIEQFVGSRNLHDHVSADSPLDDAEQIDVASSKNDDDLKNSIEQSVKPDDSSATTVVQSISNDKQNLKKIAVDTVGDSDEIGVGGPNPHKNDRPTVEPIKHEGWNSGNVPVVSHLQHDNGETSFSAAGLITYSGPIAYSGSVSLRSDGSATSGRSFAFPVLQDEWNSSPVRMAKADRRNFRKHKGWRDGLLCCRF